MKVFCDTRQARHDPQHFLSQGVLRPNPETPERLGILAGAAEAAGCRHVAPRDHGLAPIAAIHGADYLDFLQTIHADWSALDGAGPEVIPNIHPRARGDSYPSGPVGRAGYHQADTACPIAAHTWEAAYWSAQSALGAVQAMLGGDRAAYALCRPPGHHAYADQAGGFCFLNNSAIAAEALLRAGRRPAIVDLDVHHGNGTQGIFYARGDVLTVSVHADPAGFYPFFWGHAHERGDGAGLGANLNLPLAMQTGDAGFLDALGRALCRVRDFAADCLVVALGLDASAEDPFQALRVTEAGFGRIGAALAGADLPVLFVQEGGYVSEALAPSLIATLRGFQNP